ncbi:hypothetical protein ACP4OV_026791 [Aristida adscensionis]
MKAAVVTVATGVMQPVLSKLADLLKGQYAKHKSMREKIQFLHDELRAMTTTLETLEMRADEGRLSPQDRQWRDELRELSYDAEDCIDAFKTRVDHEPDGRNVFGKLLDRVKQLKQSHKTANEIEELQNRVNDISKRHKRYKIDQLPHNSTTSSVDPRLSALYEDIENLVGIDRPKKQIIELLDMEMKGSSTEVKMVSIYGCGGLGKTTLAKQVYDTIKSQFSKEKLVSAFVSVSRNPDMRKVLRDISKEVGIADKIFPDDDARQLIDKLIEHLQDKRYFIVIDDIWDTNHWEPIKYALLKNNRGSRIITTTRSITVAKFSSSHSGSVYELEPLSPDDSERLFFRRAFGSVNTHYPHLEDVPDKILEKCGGLPLAIITISSMLTDKSAKSEWDRVLNAIGSALAKTQNPDAAKMRTILSLSYTDIPHHLRTCLLYMSLFPEDYIIKKQRLINRWIAEGFVQKEQDRSSYETGESYFNELINRCLIQPVNVEYDQAKACRVHDIILDYIKCKADEENFVTTLDTSKNVYTSESYKVRRLCVLNYDGEYGTPCAGLSLSHIRSLTIFGHPTWASLEPFAVLRVLHCDYIEDHHLACVEKLIHLKYLCLTSDRMTKLPENIEELQHLQTLDVRGTNIKELPLTITKLQRLTHLYVNGDTNFPEGMIGQMHSLEELSQYGVKSYEQVMSPQDFSKLTKLRTLELKIDSSFQVDVSEGIRQSDNIRSSVRVLSLPCNLGLPDVLIRQFDGIRNFMSLLLSCNLHNLTIYDQSFKLFPLPLGSLHSAPCVFRKLCFGAYEICKVPNWMRSLGNLKVLELYILCVTPEDVEILGAIHSLFFLELRTFGGTKGKIVVHGSSGFRELKYFSLDVDACGTSLEFEVGSMPKLEHVKLRFKVHKMECLNGASNFGIQHLSALRKVEVVVVDLDWSLQDVRSYVYDPATDKNDSIIRFASAINAAVETLPNRPTLRFEKGMAPSLCHHFKCRLRSINEENGGLLSEWLKIWHIEEEPSKVVRLLYTNNGIALLALGSNAVHKLWKWKRSDRNPTGKSTASVSPKLCRPSRRVLMTNDTNDVNPEETTACIALSKNDGYVLSASGGKVSLFNMMTFKVMTTIMAPPPAATFLAFYPQDNSIIAIGMEDSTIQIYNVRFDDVKSKLKGHQKKITGLAFSQSMNVLVSSGADAQLCVWSIDGWEKKKSRYVQPPANRSGALVGDTGVQFHNDQTHILVVHESQLAIYDGNLECLRLWYPRDALPAPISSAIYSCDAVLVYAAFCDGAIGVFEAESLRLRCRIAPSAYIPPSILSGAGRVYPMVVAAHPMEPNQIALGMSDGEVHVVEPLGTDPKWGTAPTQDNGAHPAISAAPAATSNQASDQPTR